MNRFPLWSYQKCYVRKIIFINTSFSHLCIERDSKWLKFKCLCTKCTFDWCESWKLGNFRIKNFEFGKNLQFSSISSSHTIYDKKGSNLSNFKPFLGLLSSTFLTLFQIYFWYFFLLFCEYSKLFQKRSAVARGPTVRNWPNPL